MLLFIVGLFCLLLVVGYFVTGGEDSLSWAIKAIIFIGAIVFLVFIGFVVYTLLSLR